MKKAVILTLSILLIFAFASCSQNGETADNTASDNSSSSGSSVIISTDEEYSSEQANSAPEPSEPVATATPVPRATAGESEDVTYNSNVIEVVYNDPEDGKTYTESYDAGENAGADAALDAVNELLLKGKFGDIGFNKVVKTGSNIFIDFDESVYNLEQYPLLEQPTLEAIADAYLNNVEGVTGVYFTVNGSGYSSMNIEYDADEPFKMK